MTKMDVFRALPRPLLGYSGIPLLFCAVLMPQVSAEKLKALVFFLVLAYGLRGAEKCTAMVTGYFEGRD